MTVISFEQALLQGETPRSIELIAEWNEAQIGLDINKDGDEKALARHRQQAVELYALAEQLKWKDLPTDLAKNHDHYLYGAEKKA